MQIASVALGEYIRKCHSLFQVLNIAKGPTWTHPNTTINDSRLNEQNKNTLYPPLATSMIKVYLYLSTVDPGFKSQ